MGVGKQKQGPSPRKLLRRLSAADEVDRELAEEVRRYEALMMRGWSCL